MNAPPAHSPGMVGAALLAHKLSDGRFGPNSHTTSTCSAMCDTCPVGSPLLVRPIDSPPPGCFMWRPETGAPRSTETGLPLWDSMPTLWTQH
eukprot:6275714-Pyramimonas_sp.AAC.1